MKSMALTLQNDILFQSFSLLVLQTRSMAKDIAQNYSKLQCFGGVWRCIATKCFHMSVDGNG